MEKTQSEIVKMSLEKLESDLKEFDLFKDDIMRRRKAKITGLPYRAEVRNEGQKTINFNTYNYE